jgi:hypothetical protein
MITKKEEKKPENPEPEEKKPKGLRTVEEINTKVDQLSNDVTEIKNHLQEKAISEINNPEKPEEKNPDDNIDDNIDDNNDDNNEEYAGTIFQQD